jgi:hypothetical protein
MGKTIYFDTNVIRDLSEKRNGVSDLDIALVKSRVNIAPSFEVLYELLSAPYDSIRRQNAEVYVDIADWKSAVKTSDELLRDDIESCIQRHRPCVPYKSLDAEQSACLESICAGKDVVPNWTTVVERSRKQNTRFVEQVFKAFVVKLPDEAKASLRAAPEEVWNGWWAAGGLAEIMASDLAGQPLESGSLLLSIPSIRGTIGYLLHTWKSQIVSGYQPKATAHYDFRHAVIGAAVGRLVTGDKKLRVAIQDIPRLKVKVSTLRELIDELAA